jgi:hypothetical protein
MIGLEQFSKSLVARLARASAAEQRAASIAAVEFAINRAKLEDSRVAAALATLRANQILPKKDRTDIEKLTAELDEAYFALQEAAEEGTATTEEYLAMFAKARAAAALGFAGIEDPFRAATEAIYEAAATIISDDKRELLALIESQLKTGP